MPIIITKPHLQVVTLGLLAGMRSMSAPAITSSILSRQHNKSIANSPFKFLQSGITAKLLSALAIGEFVGDKIPSAPDRIAPTALIGRCIAGALSGAAIYQTRRGNSYSGALLGGATALAATFGSFYLRKALVKHAHLIDPVIGTIEDAIVLGTGLGLAKTY